MTMDRSHRNADRWAKAAAVLVAFAALAAVFGILQLHAATADWWPKAVPTRAQYDGRDFSCLDGGRARVVPSSALDGMVPRGRTIGGGVIYAPPGDQLPLGILVAADGEVRACSLSGGP